MLTKDRRHVSTLATLSVTLGSFPAKTAAAAGAALGGGGGEEGAAEGGAIAQHAANVAGEGCSREYFHLVCNDYSLFCPDIYLS